MHPLHAAYESATIAHTLEDVFALTDMLDGSVREATLWWAYAETIVRDGLAAMPHLPSADALQTRIAEVAARKDKFVREARYEEAAGQRDRLTALEAALERVRRAPSAVHAEESESHACALLDQIESLVTPISYERFKTAARRIVANNSDAVFARQLVSGSLARALQHPRQLQNKFESTVRRTHKIRNASMKAAMLGMIQRWQEHTLAAVRQAEEHYTEFCEQVVGLLLRAK